LLAKSGAGRKYFCGVVSTNPNRAVQFILNLLFNRKRVDFVTLDFTKFINRKKEGEKRRGGEWESRTLHTSSK
jgi:hypothetical protein